MPGLPRVGEEFAGYRLVAVLGRGGMSTVFRAENPRLGNLIALKVMATELASDDVFRARFFEESRIAAGLNHPNVVPIHDSGSSGGLLYIAMRYVMGTDLRQLVRKRGRLTARTSLFLLTQAARALDTAHRRGLVHRDVKPGNLLIEQGSDDADPDHLYLTDFGITKNVGERSGLTPTGQYLGTLDYIAPEQVRGLPVDGLADQYSLGCVLYESLTGRLPFERDLNAAIIWAHVEEPPPRPTMLRPDLPRAVDAVFAKVLAKRPADRFGNCREFMAAAGEALGPLAGQRGASIPPPRPPGERSAPKAGRFPALVSADPLDRAAQAARAAQATRPPEVAHAEAGARGRGTDSIPGQAAWSPSSAKSPAARLIAPPSLPVTSGEAGTGYVMTEGAGGPPPGGSPPSSSHRRPRRRRRGGARSWAAIAVGTFLLAATCSLIGVKLTSGNEDLASSSSDTTPSAGIGTASAGIGKASAGIGKASASIGKASASTGTTGTSESTTGTPAPGDSMDMGTQGGAGESGPSTLAGVLMAANSSEEGKGLLPPANCDGYRQNANGQIICTNPVPGVAMIYYQNYQTLKALYGAYETQVSALDGGQAFTQNTGTCGTGAVPYAEFAWNMEQGHPHNYTVAQMAANTVPQINAGGRMACFAVNTAHGVTEYIVWTIDNGPALGVADGSPAAVYELWASLHHAVMFRDTEMCGSNSRMNMSDVPTGNLKVIPVCPAGVQGVS